MIDAWLVSGSPFRNGVLLTVDFYQKSLKWNVKINNLKNKKSAPKCCAIFFSKINPDAHVSTKINTITFYKGGLRDNSPTSQNNVKRRRLFVCCFRSSKLSD